MAIEEEIARAIGENFQACRGRNGVSRTELAAALMPLLNRVRAEALREAAREMRLHGITDFDAGYVSTYEPSHADWLDAYADRVEQNSEGESGA